MRLGLVFLVLSLTGCGAAATRAPTSPPASVAPSGHALSELDRAEAELDAALGSPHLTRFATPPPPAAAPAPGLSPAPAAEPNKAGRVDDARDAPSVTGVAPDRAAQAAASGASAEGAPAQDRCAVACRALASMTRATESLCELREGDATCVDARARVESAAERVRSACPSCRP